MLCGLFVTYNGSKWIEFLKWSVLIKSFQMWFLSVRLSCHFVKSLYRSNFLYLQNYLITSFMFSSQIPCQLTIVLMTKKFLPIHFFRIYRPQTTTTQHNQNIKCSLVKHWYLQGVPENCLRSDVLTVTLNPFICGKSVTPLYSPHNYN